MKIDEFVYGLCTEGKNFASLATLMPDGSPQVSLTWVDSDGEYILINTAEGRVKTENMPSKEATFMAEAASRPEARKVK